MVSLSQEVFELRYARMPEEPPTPVKKPVGSKLKKIRGISSESSDESSPEDTDSSSSEESESESERANQLSYLQKQVRLIFQFSELGNVLLFLHLWWFKFKALTLYMKSSLHHCCYVPLR